MRSLARDCFTFGPILKLNLQLNCKLLFLNNYIFLVFSALGALAAPASAASQSAGLVPRAVALTLAPQTLMPAAALAAACRKLVEPCNPQTTKVWMGTVQPLGKLFLIDSSRPLIAVLQRDTIAQQWDFSTYRHSRAQPGHGTGEPLEIHPAFYPAGDGGYAVALVSRQREAYSGGGADFAFADFVTLSSDPKPRTAAYALRYAGVPFSCSKMMRACFDEREYKTSSHCHHEMNGYLTIQFPPRGSAEAGWSFTWHQTDWPAHVGKNRLHHTRSRFTLPAHAAAGDKALPANVSFCGGPQ